MTKEFLPQPVSDRDVAFGGKAMDLLPKWEEIPKDMQDLNCRHWAYRLTETLFFEGGSIANLTPKEGIDKKMGIRHIKAILGSYAPKHEHKIGGCAYLFSLWFEPAQPAEEK